MVDQREHFGRTLCIGGELLWVRIEGFGERNGTDSASGIGFRPAG